MLVGWALFSYFHKASLDLCWSDRSQNHGIKHFTLITKFLFNTSVVTMLLGFLQVALWAPPSGVKSRIFNVHNLFGITFTLIWYIVTYMFCLLGKEILADTTCSHSKNSVSGHYAFHVYYFLALPYAYISVKTYEAVEDAEEAKKLKPKERKKTNGWIDFDQRTISLFGRSLNRELAMIVTFVIFTISTSLTLFRTLIYGYHSVRQIFYGALLAVISHYVSMRLRPYANMFPLHIAAFITVALLVLTSVVSSYGPVPLDFGEKLAYGASWLGMVYCSWEKYRHMRAGKKKRD